MIMSFGDKDTEEFYKNGTSKKIPSDIQERALNRLDFLDNVASLQDIKNSPRSYRFHSLKKDLIDFYSISINMKFRIIFKFENNNVYVVEILDYH